MPTNLEIATSKLLHPSNSKKFFPYGRGSIEKPYAFPMVEFLREELSPAYEVTKPEYADDEISGLLYDAAIMDLIRHGRGDYNSKYKYLIYAFNDKEITVDEFMHYSRALAEHERKKQVAENPGTTGNSTEKVSKLPSQSVNSDTYSGSAKTPVRGILGTGFIRKIASKLAVNWGSKDKS